MNTHKALVRKSNGDLKYCLVERPSTDDSMVLVALHTVGVCGTDLQILRGLRRDPTPIIGHEAIGKIVEVGKDVIGFRVGDRVSFNPTNPVNQDRILGHNMLGVFQEYLLMNRSDIEQGMLEKIDADLPDYLGALIEPLASVIYAHELVTQVLPIRSAAIFGAGIIGLLHALHLQISGTCRTFLIHPDRGRLKWAVGRGCIDPDSVILNETNLLYQILEQTGGQGLDAAFVCTPRNASLEALDMAIQLVKPGGCIDLFGGFEPKVELPQLPDIDLNEIRRTNFCGQPWPGRIAQVETRCGRNFALTGHRGVSKKHLHQSIDCLRRAPQWYGRLITHVASLQASAFFLNQFRRDGIRRIHSQEWVKLVIDCRINDFSIETFDFTSFLCVAQK